jgi:drug/metabolite transporter (DMT)-like permease
MRLIIKDAPEMPQALSLGGFLLSFAGLIFIIIQSLYSENLQNSLIGIIFLLILTIVFGLLFLNIRRRFISIVEERKKLDEGKPVFEPTNKSIWYSVGWIYMLRLAAIPIFIVIYLIFELFLKIENRLVSMTAALIVFIIYAIITVKYVNKRK